jgi:hypothetical protein
MTPAKLSCLSALVTSVSALILWGSPLCAQPLNPRTPLGMAARATAVRGLAGRAVNNPMAATITLTQAQGTLITFDAPGAGNTAYSGTYLVSINPAGEILGSITDSSSGVTGFLRSRQGTFTTFNISGASAYTFSLWGEGPAGSSLNPSGEATGGYVDANGTFHGFVRAPAVPSQRSTPPELT